MTTPNLPAWAEDVHDDRLAGFGRTYERCPVCDDFYCGGDCEPAEDGAA